MTRQVAILAHGQVTHQAENAMGRRKIVMNETRRAVSRTQLHAKGNYPSRRRKRRNIKR